MTPGQRRIRADAPTVAVDVFVSAMKVSLLFFGAWAVLGTIVLQAQGQLLTADGWRDMISGGLSQGAMYGLIALGYSMVYGVLGFINFAHGEVFMAGGVTGFFVANIVYDAGLWDSAFLVAFILVILAAMLSSAIIAVTIERVAYRRLRGAPRLMPLITSIGVSFFMQYLVRGLFGGRQMFYPDYPESVSRRYNVFGLEIAGARLIVVVVSVIAMVGLWLFVTRSKTGRAMRAVSEDKEIAALMGIDVDKTIVRTFAVGGAMAGIAGVMWALIFRYVFFLTGFLPGIKAFTAAVLGGIGNLPGAMLGGLTLGMVEAAGPTLLGSLRWAIPAWLAYGVGTLSIVGVVFGIRRWREGKITRMTSAVSMMVLGALLAVASFSVLPGFNVIIPGASELKDMIAFIVLIGVLMIRPVGLLGERLSVEERG